MNSRRYRGLLLMVLISAVLLAACGSSNKEAPSLVTGAGVATVGFEKCYNCHADERNPALYQVAFGDTVKGSSTSVITGVYGNEPSPGPDFRTGMRGWLNGPHGNYESWVSFAKTDNAPANTGFPDYTELAASSLCAKCHDPLGEGKTIANNYIQTGNDMLGSIDRPVIGCESCHGGGGNHFGLGPLPIQKPGPDQCGQCHNAEFGQGSELASHLQYHPEGGRIVEDYKASKHAGSIESHNYVTGSNTDVKALCSRCHTNEGAKRYLLASAGTMTHDQLITALAGKPDIPNASVVQCKTCHDDHNQLIMLGQKALDAAIIPGTWSTEFATCTSCHQLLKTDASLNDEGYHAPYNSAGATINSYASMEESIADTHYDLASTPVVSVLDTTAFNSGTGGIEGYVVDPTATHDPNQGNSNSGACLDCHNEHKASIEINKQWARSAHGGFILTKKEAASNAYTEAVLDADAAAWIHYNWKDNSGGSTGIGRQQCQRCHTATGFRNFANNQAAYDADRNGLPDILNDYSRLSGGQAELLYCWACHTDNVGTIRNPGQIIANYDVYAGSAAPNNAVNLAAVVTYTYPDVSKSNVCMGCHTARENGESIAALNTQATPTTIDFSNQSFINSHYLSAGGTIFSATGYTFNRGYTAPTSYRHDKIGTASAANTGDGGPCVGCHMSAAESHLFLPVEKDETTDVITRVTSPVCSRCHGSAVTPSFLESRKAIFEEAMEALKRQLDIRGYYFNDAHPYFYQRRDITGTIAITNGSATVTGTGTAWTTAGTSSGTAVAVNDLFKVNADGTYYKITARTDTTLTLSKAYAGQSVSGASYAIIKGGSSGAVKNWLTRAAPAPFAVPDTDKTGATSGKNNMGASFNFNLLDHDFGAYAHNRTYANRLIYDAIDWLDDNQLNYSTGATLNALDAADNPYKTDAINFILVNGTATGTSSERP